MRSVQPQLRCSRGRVARITEIKLIFMKNAHKEYANPLKHRECGNNTTLERKIHTRLQRQGRGSEEGGQNCLKWCVS